MEFNVRQTVIDRLRATKRANIGAVIEYMDRHGFFTRHCHHHHRYRGGLAHHAWQTYQIAKGLADPALDGDSIAIASLLHDFCNCSGMRHLGGHGRRSAKMLKELGFKLTKEEFLAIRFHMSLRNKKEHSLYSDALHSPLRDLVNAADGQSASLYKGYDVPVENRTAQYFLQNITQLDNRDVILKTLEGWLLSLHSPYDGEVEPEWRGKVIGGSSYEFAELYTINDSFFGAMYVLSSKGKKALFTLHHCHGMMGGCYFSPDENPFIYSNIKIYANMEGCNHFDGAIDNWSSYGYAACEINGMWKLIKVTQFPDPGYTVVGEGFSSAEEAMKFIGIDDCTKYLCKGMKA